MVRPKPCVHQRFTCLPCAIAGWARREAEALPREPGTGARSESAEAIIRLAEAIERGQPWKETR